MPAFVHAIAEVESGAAVITTTLKAEDPIENEYVPLMLGNDTMNSNKKPVLSLAMEENMVCSLMPCASAGLDTMHGI